MHCATNVELPTGLIGPNPASTGANTLRIKHLWVPVSAAALIWVVQGCGVLFALISFRFLFIVDCLHVLIMCLLAFCILAGPMPPV